MWSKREYVGPQASAKTHEIVVPVVPTAQVLHRNITQSPINIGWGPMGAFVVSRQRSRHAEKICENLFGGLDEVAAERFDASWGASGADSRQIRGDPAT